MLIARLFGLGAFGVYQACLAVLDALSRIGTVGAAGAQHLFIARHRAAGEPELELGALGTGVRTALAASTVLAIALALAAGPVARAYHEPRLASVLPLMVPAITCLALTNVLVAAMFGAKVARMAFYVRGVAEPSFLLIAGVVTWAAGGGLRALAVAHVVACAATAAVALAAAARVFGARRLAAAMRLPAHPGYLRFALPLTVADAMSTVLARVDVVLLTAFAGVDAVGVYAAAEFIARVIVNARFIFDPIAAPVLSEAFHSGRRDRLAYNLRLMTRWAITAACPITVTVIVLRVPLLGLYGPSFTAGASTLVVLALFQLVSAGLGLTPHTLLMAGRSRLMLINQACAAALNVTLGLLLIPRLGMLGAAIALAASVITLQAALVLEAWVLQRIHPFAPALGKPLAATAATLAVELGARALPLPAPARIAVVIAAGALTYAASLLLLGLPDEEQRLWTRVKARLGVASRQGRV